MTFYMLVYLFIVQVPVVFQTLGLGSRVEIFKFNLVCRFFFEIQQPRKVYLNLLFFFFVKRLFLLVQIVDNEKVFSILFIKVDTIDFFIIWLAVANNITEMVTVVKNVIRWIYKNFHLISDFKLDCY
jgi:hypothetical protein